MGNQVWYKIVGFEADRVMVDKDAVIVDLKAAIIKDNQRGPLSSASRGSLRVFPHGVDINDDALALDPGSLVPTNTTGTTPLVVKVIVLQDQQHDHSDNFRMPNYSNRPPKNPKLAAQQRQRSLC